MIERNSLSRIHIFGHFNNILFLICFLRRVFEIDLVGGASFLLYLPKEMKVMIVSFSFLLHGVQSLADVGENIVGTPLSGNLEHRVQN